MASTLSQLDQRITVLTHKSGGVISESDRFAMYNLALDMLGQRLDLYETKRRTVLTPSLFTDVWEYAVPNDLKGDAIIDVRAIGERGVIYEKKTNVPFDYEVRRGVGLADFTMEVNNGTRVLRINSKENPKYQIIHDMGSLTDNGTWAIVAGTDAANLAVDTQNGIDSQTALRFDIDVSASVTNTATIRNTTFTAVDLTDYQNKGSVFFKVYFPAATTNITSIELRIGSDTGNYLSATKTVQSTGESFTAGKNLIRVDWSDFSTTGAPVITAIDYSEITINYGAGQTDMNGVLVDQLVARYGKLHELYYYSDQIVVTASGARSRTFSTSTDTTVLGSEAESALVFLSAMLLSKGKRDPDGPDFKALYEEEVDAYGRKYPSERPFLGLEYQRFGDDPNNWITDDVPRYV